VYSLKNNGDWIAQEFAGLMGGAAVAAPPASANIKTASEKAPKCDLSSELEDMILDGPSEEEDYVSDLMENNISDMEEYACDSDLDVSAKQKYILSGLNKISKDLRNKGEVFAADVVEATINGITDDLRKEANKSKDVVNALSKIAEELATSGDQFAADMVIATRNKIS
jgi:hypothetical protein